MKTFISIAASLALALTVDAAKANQTSTLAQLNTAVVNHKLNYTVLNSQATSAETNVPAGITNLDNPTTIVCSNAAGCTIIARAEVQLQLLDLGEWGICLLVDGKPMASGGCPYASTGFSGETIQSAVQLDHASVSRGTHTVQTQVNIQNEGATVYWWQSEYGVYAP